MRASVVVRERFSMVLSSGWFGMVPARRRIVRAMRKAAGIPAMLATLANDPGYEVVDLTDRLQNVQIPRLTRDDNDADQETRPFVAAAPQGRLIMKKLFDEIRSSEVTPEDAYLNRRQFMGKAGALGLGLVAASTLAGCADDGIKSYSAGGEVEASQGEKANTYEEITHYNNFYEFGYGKEDPSDPDLNKKFKPMPWTVRVEGMVKKPADYHLEDLIKLGKVEDRTYRFRCVEAWSMVIPWQGVTLASILNKVEPQAGAKFVEFTTVLRPSEMPGQQGN